MRGSIAIEALLISVVAIFLLVFAGNAVQAYGAKFAEDVDRMAWVRQSVYKIYASVRMLENCEVGSMDTIDVYVPEGGAVYLVWDDILGVVWNINRVYDHPLLTNDEYVYSMEVDANFTWTYISPGWARIQLKKIAEDTIEANVVMTGLISWDST